MSAIPMSATSRQWEPDESGAATPGGIMDSKVKDTQGGSHVASEGKSDRHTPGPWYFGQWEESAADQWFVGPTAEGSGVRGDDEYMLMHGICQEADARLMATAPDFYEEAKKVVAWLDRLAERAAERSHDDRFPTLAEANAKDAVNFRKSAQGLKRAIAKVEGVDR